MTTQELIHRYLDGDLDSVQEDVLFAELASNPALRTELNEQVRVHRLAKSDMAATTVDPALSASVFAAVGAVMPGPSPTAEGVRPLADTASRLPLSRLRISALLLLGALCSVGLLYLSSDLRSIVFGSASNTIPAVSQAEQQALPAQPRYSVPDHTVSTERNNAPAQQFRTSVSSSHNISHPALQSKSTYRSKVDRRSLVDRPALTSEDASGGLGQDRFIGLAQSLKQQTNDEEVDEPRSRPSEQPHDLAANANQKLLVGAPGNTVPVAMQPSRYMVESQIRPFALLFPQTDRTTDHHPDLDNVSIMFGYRLSQDQLLGLRLGRESYSMRTTTAGPQPGADDHEHNSLYGVGLVYRYEPSELSLFEGNFQPYAEVYAGAIEHGLRFDGGFGCRLFARAPLSLLVALDYAEILKLSSGHNDSGQVLGMQIGLQVQW